MRVLVCVFVCAVPVHVWAFVRGSYDLLTAPPHFLQARAALLLSSTIKAVAGDVTLTASLQSALLPFASLLAATANDLPTLKHAAQPDLSIDLQVGAPNSVAEVANQVGALLAAIAPGPGALWDVPVADGYVAFTDPSFAAKPGGARLSSLPRVCAFQEGDLVTLRSEEQGVGVTEVGVVTGAPEGVTFQENRLPFLIDTPVLVSFNNKPITVPESRLRLQHRTAPASDAKGETSVFYVADDSAEGSSGSGSSKWSLDATLAASKHRVWGFTVASLNLLTAMCAKEVLLALLAAPARPGAVPLPPTPAELAQTVAALFSQVSGQVVAGKDASDLLLSTVVSSMTSSEAGPQLLRLAASQLRATAKTAAYELAKNPPPATKTYESKHDYEVCRWGGG
ncbi:MAG: hypothetical protein P4L40_07635 [Terracidiphilus sp.]|nr:hypothetical protein [Terracidiphilus sp.]